MKARLLHPGADGDWRGVLQAVAAQRGVPVDRHHPRPNAFDPGRGLPWNAAALTADLGLNTVFTAMADGDDHIFAVARKVVLASVRGDIGTIRYRQRMLGDCLENATCVRRLDDLLERLAPGDTIVVSELSRLGRSLGEMVQIVEQLKEKEVALIAIKQGINTRSDSDMASKCIIYLSGMFAELERDFLSQRTKNGLERAKAQGKVLGRRKGSLGKSKMDDRIDEIKRLINLNVPKASIAKILGVSRQSLYKFIESRNINVQ